MEKKLTKYIKECSAVFIVTLLCLTSSQSNAHVKWFADFDLNSPPRPLLSVLLNQQFFIFAIITTILMFIVAYIDSHITFQPPKKYTLMANITQKTENAMPIFLRLGVCAFFLALANEGGTILTPELTTTASWISWLQIGLALTALHHRTAVITGIGIVFLYIFAIREYGLFHVLDYPIFVGIAIYMILVSLKGKEKQSTALAILRVATGITLLWGSVEKWAFPEWSFEIIADKPELAMGLSRELFMIIAGFVEFCAAFLLITGRASSRASALLLLFILVPAIWSFGYIDAVGHAPVIVVLVILIFSENTLAAKLDIHRDIQGTAMLHSCWYIAAILTFYLSYYVGYYSQYPTLNS